MLEIAGKFLSAGELHSCTVMSGCCALATAGAGSEEESAVGVSVCMAGGAVIHSARNVSMRGGNVQLLVSWK